LRKERGRVKKKDSGEKVQLETFVVENKPQKNASSVCRKEIKQRASFRQRLVEERGGVGSLILLSAGRYSKKIKGRAFKSLGRRADSRA